MIYPVTASNTCLQPILREIVWHKRLEVAQIQQEMSIASLQRQLTAAPTVRDFFTALQQSASQPALIAEIKKASPFVEKTGESFDPLTLAQSYERGGATCISVATDQKFFQGGFDHLRIIRHRTSIPLLCNDFILDPCQIYLARAAGADAVLLIAGILTDREIQNFLRVIHYLGMNAVVEVHDLAELDRVLKLDDVRIVGINNRNLENLTVDINTTETLLAARRSHLQNLGILVISEAAIETPADLSLLVDAGAQAVIVGEPLLPIRDVEASLHSLIQTISPLYKDLFRKKVKG